MLETFRRLGLGLFLIGAAGALLLYSDLGSRVQTEAAPSPGQKTIRVAVLQHASQVILDEGREGMLAGLAERGWHQGKNLEVKRYNAEGDMPVGQAIAREMANGGNDLLLTISTPSLQAVANANRSTRIPHVFALVTDPVAAGVGVSADNPLDHPAWLAGYGTMQPVAKAFQTAREMNPDLKTVGVVWNAAEANSEAQVKLARQVCADMGISLLEATVENSAGVGESAASLTARGAEALWVNGDVTVMTAIDSVVAAANKARIPVFSVIPPNVKRGALFDLGADYHEVGRLAGLLAGDILNGRNPAQIPIVNAMPEVLTLNLQALNNLKGTWNVPDSLKKSARLVIDENGGEDNRAAPQAVATPTPEPGRTYRMALAYYVPEPSRDSCEKGLLDGLADLGFVEGKNLLVSRAHAQGEVVNIPSIIQNFDNSPNNVIVTFSTPVLQAALATAKNKPIVFTYVTDPIAAGAGRSYTDHLPNVTGIGTLPPVDEAIAVARRVFPHLKTVGSISNNGEASSARVAELLRNVCQDQGLQLAAVTVNTPGDVMQAAQSLVARGVDVIYVAADNTVVQALDSLMSVATKAGIPVINEDPDYLDRGALFAVGPGFYHSGKAAAPLVARVLTGEDPADIPMANVSVNVTKFNPKAAAQLGLKIPPELIQELTRTETATPNPTGRLWKIGVVLYNESPPAEETLEGMAEAWKESPLVEGKDYTIKIRSAQGDMAAISGCLETAVSEGVDILVPLSTPSLQTAISRIRNKPIVFSMVANPMAAGAGKSYTDHLPNVTGATVLAPFGEMLDLLEKHYPSFKRLGTLFCPSEANSVDLKDAFAAECKKRGFTLEVVAANSPAELADAAVSLMTRPIDAVVQISDNLSSTGFTAITKAARQARKPLFSLNSTTMPLGAAVAMGRDYHEAGRETVRLIERVIRGEDPGRIPFVLPPKVVLATSRPNAAATGFSIPDALQREAKPAID